MWQLQTPQVAGQEARTRLPSDGSWQYWARELQPWPPPTAGELLSTQLQLPRLPLQEPEDRQLMLTVPSSV